MATKTKFGPKSTKCGCGVARGPRDSRKGSLPNVAMYAVRASGQRSASPSDRTYHAYGLGSGMGLTCWQWVEVKIKLLVRSRDVEFTCCREAWEGNLELEPEPGKLPVPVQCHWQWQWQWKQGRRQPLEDFQYQTRHGLHFGTGRAGPGRPEVVPEPQQRCITAQHSTALVNNQSLAGFARLIADLMFPDLKILPWLALR